MSRVRPTALTLLGFDYGKRRTGVAVGQTITRTATPLETLNCNGTEPDWLIVGHLIEQWQPQALVVGVPIITKSQGKELIRLIQRFCGSLGNRYGLPVYTCDESYTSAEAYQQLKEMRRAGHRKRIAKEKIDSLAAAILLEAWMASPAPISN